MSKQQKANAQSEINTEENKDKLSQGVIAKEEKKQKSKDAKKKKDKKKEKKGGLVKKTKETVSELKKVTWPSFGEVVKKTGIVIAFVVLFGLFIAGVNALLSWLFVDLLV